MKINKNKEPICEEITGGNHALIKREAPDARENFYLVDNNHAIDKTGQLTHFRIYADNANPLQLVIYRHSDSYSVVGKSQVVTPKEGENEFRIDEPINVEEGDLVGIYYPKAGSVSFDRITEEWDLFNLSGIVLFTNSGAQPTEFSGSSNRLYSIDVFGIICSKGAPQEEALQEEALQEAAQEEAPHEQ